VTGSKVHQVKRLARRRRALCSTEAGGFIGATAFLGITVPVDGVQAEILLGLQAVAERTFHGLIEIRVIDTRIKSGTAGIAVIFI